MINHDELILTIVKLPTGISNSSELDSHGGCGVALEMLRLSRGEKAGQIAGCASTDQYLLRCLWIYSWQLNRWELKLTPNLAGYLWSCLVLDGVFSPPCESPKGSSNHVWRTVESRAQESCSEPRAPTDTLVFPEFGNSMSMCYVWNDNSLRCIFL